MWETLQSTAPIFLFPTKIVCLAAPRGLALSGQLISGFCNMSSTKQEIINVPI